MAFRHNYYFLTSGIIKISKGRKISKVYYYLLIMPTYFNSFKLFQLSEYFFHYLKVFMYNNMLKKN